MSFGAIIYNILIGPLKLFFEVIYTITNNLIHNPGLSIVVLSLTMNFLVLPLYRRADAVQEEERDIENKLKDGVAHIRKTFKGDEKMMILQTYYRQNHYKPTDVFKGSVSLLLEIPFFIAAYQFLSHLSILSGVSFGIIQDLGAQDGLISLGNWSVNLLPIIMTTVNLVSCVIYTKGYPLKTKIQLYGMAIFFFFFLYKSPAGLVFYWTLNNVFSLIKTCFYKMKHPGTVLSVIAALAGVVLIATSPLAYRTTGRRLVLVLGVIIGAALICPLIWTLIRGKIRSKVKFAFYNKMQSCGGIFLSGAIYLTILIGVLIPSAVVKSSPQEFIDLTSYSNPLWFVVGSVSLAAGLCIVWLGVFYLLTDKKGRVFWEIGIWITCVTATVDYLFFGGNKGILTRSLKYENDFVFTTGEKILNIAVIVLIIIFCTVLMLLLKRKIRFVLAIGAIAIGVMSTINVVTAADLIGNAKDRVKHIADATPSLRLSETGRNVVVIMMDRAISEYIPYFVEEKPELKEMYDGFTYYPNTLSFGPHTNVGSPALYGGYEYTPEELNKRSDEALVSKHNEALKVMPVMFYEEGYEVTVCDPSYAGYQWIPDLSIYDDYPEMHTYITDGYFWEAGDDDLKRKNLRNFFCYSVMRVSPVIVRDILYNNGNYNESISAEELSTNVENTVVTATGDDCFKTTGVTVPFIKAYTTLDKMSEMTQLSDNDKGAFIMIANDTAHSPQLLAEPSYTPQYIVDNTEYEIANSDRYTVNGRTLTMETPTQYEHYQSNMCALLTLGKWMEYLKAEDLYDNTRIIIVADHGRDLHHNSDAELGDGSDVLTDIEYYNPLLMVKDFDDKGFKTDEELMTNADTPSLATKGIIYNPVNPFTGNTIDNSAKKEGTLKVFGTEISGVDINNGNTFLPGIWFMVEGDMRDKNNWSILNDER